MLKNKFNKELILFSIFVFFSISMHYFSELSLLKYSFKLFEVSMHEFGHGFASLILGGNVVDLHLEYNQGHVVHQTKESYKSIVSFSGYLSASLFGYLIYISSLYATNIIKIFLIFITSFWFYYADGINTIFLLSVIILTLILSWYLKQIGSYLIRFISVYIMVSSIYSPTYLISYDKSGDHVAMYESTGIPSIFWVCIWVILGLFFIYRAFRDTLKYKNKEKEEVITEIN